MYLQCAGEFEEILLAIPVTEDVNQPVKIRNRVLSITAHGSTVKSPSGLRWLGSLELLVQKLSNIWIVAVCVNRVLHSNRLAGCLCVALCPQLPRDNIQFVRKPTDFASARFSTSSSAVHSRILWNSSLSLLSFPLSRPSPPILFMFNFVSYILSFYPGPRRLVFFVRETVLLNRLRVPSSRPGVPSFSSFYIFHISVVRSKLIGCFNRSLGLQQYR